MVAQPGRSMECIALIQGVLLTCVPEELKLRVYHEALDHSGLMTPSRLIKEGNYYYSIGFEIHRNSKDLDVQTGEAPIDKYGYMLVRTKNISEPQGWEAWVSGDVFDPITKGDFNAFLPQSNGSGIMPRSPNLSLTSTNPHSHLYLVGSERAHLLHDH